jgi:leader peptidase (prepilin peptidase) / N-methyltransferase
MSTPWPILVLIGILGLAIGSFLNVVIYRVPRGESLLFPGSHCPVCKTALRAQHNIPVVSWFALRGRCAVCRSRISVRYPLVELSMAALFVAITLHFGLSLRLPAYLYLAAIGLTLAMIDKDVRKLPDSILLPSYVVCVGLLLPAGSVDGNWWPAERAVLGMLALSGIYAVLAVGHRGAIDLGEIKLAGLVGLCLGWASWPALVMAAFGSLLICGLTQSSSFSAGRHSADRALVLAPAVLIASGVSLFVAVPLLTWYGSLYATA